MYGAFDVVLYFVNPTVLVANKLTSYLILSYKLQEFKFYHKLINRQLPKYFERFVYHTNLDLHNYNTRIGHRLHIPRINHAFAQLNIRHSVIQTVNSIPDNVSDKIRTHSLKGFSTYAKNYFISKYETTCEIANCYVCQQ